MPFGTPPYSWYTMINIDFYENSITPIVGQVVWGGSRLSSSFWRRLRSAALLGNTAQSWYVSQYCIGLPMCHDASILVKATWV